MNDESNLILIVDDDESLTLIIKAYLESFGYNAMIVHSGRQAIHYCKSNTPDLILLDLVMPDMNGIQTCTHLKMIPSLKNVPVIMLTGNSDSKSIIDSFDAGAVDFLTKPINEVLLDNRISSALRTTKLNTTLINKQKELYRTQKIARTGTIRIDIDNTLIEISTSCYHDFGFDYISTIYTLDEFLSHIHTDDRKHVSATLQHSLKHREDHKLEYRFIAPDENEYHFTHHCEYIHNIDTKDSYLFGSFKDVSESRMLENSLLEIRYLDTLTNLPNKTYFQNKLNSIIENPPTESLFAVLFIGLDNFTRVNDQYSHTGGDIVLQAIAERLKKIDLISSQVSRFSGDVFTVLLTNLKHIDECEKSINHILQTVNQPISYQDDVINITASIGASVFPLEGDSSEELLTGAEAAMILSRENGGNRFTYRTHDMNLATQRKLKLLNEIKFALQEDQFVVFYQPQVDASTMEIVGIEALVRWIHPEQGIIPPDEFIAAAEESGLIVELGRHVLNEACLQTKRWLDMGYQLTVGVNVSIKQFEEENFIDTVIDALKSTGLPPEALEIEITENISMRNHQHTIETLNSLRALNIKTSMDDFGTGFSSLSQLQTLPLDILKVDQAFVRCIVSEKSLDHAEKVYQSCAIATAIIAMAHTLGLKVIAEGVETEEQCEFLKSQNSEMLQGYLFSSPVPADELEKLLLTSGKNTDSEKDISSSSTNDNLILL